MANPEKDIREILGAELMVGEEKDELNAKFVSAYFPAWVRRRELCRFAYRSRAKLS